MPAKIKKKELELIKAYLQAGRFFEARWIMAEILAAHGCDFNKFMVTSNGWIMEIPEFLSKQK